MYLPDFTKIGSIFPFPEGLVVDIPPAENQSVQIQFDPEKGEFIATVSTAEGTDTRSATLAETMAYCDYFACQTLDLQALKLRLLETSLGFIPSFQHKVEYAYKQFFEARLKEWKSGEPNFPKDVRKKQFENGFREQILPLAQRFGFERATKASHRLVRDFGNGITVVMYFEYIKFGYGGYSVQAYYYESSFGNPENDGPYLAQVLPHFPHSTNIAMDARTPEYLEWAICDWLRTAELYLFPFLERHGTHAQILANIQAKEKLDQIRAQWGIHPMHQKAPYYFELHLNRREECRALLENKG